MPEFTTVNIPYVSDMEIAVNPIYYVVENYGSNIKPKVIACFLSFQDTRRFVFAQKKQFPWPTYDYDVRRFTTNGLVDIGAEED